MTQKEFFKMVKEGNLNDEVKAYASIVCERFEAKDREKNEKNKALRTQIESLLSEGSKTVHEIAAATGFKWQSISPILVKMSQEEGLIRAEKVVKDGRLITLYSAL